MPVEIVGEFGTPSASREWLSAQAVVAIKHIVNACGPPPEMELDIQWQEHELGSYPSIVLPWEDAMRGVPGKYVSKCQDALFEFECGETPPSLPCWWDDEEDSEEEVESED